MRTTLNIDDELLAKAEEVTGIKEKTSLVKLGLEALIARVSTPVEFSPISPIENSPDATRLSCR